MRYGSSFTCPAYYAYKEAFGEFLKVLQRVVAAIQTVENLSSQAQFLNVSSELPEKRRGPGLAMLFSGTQLLVEHVALRADVGKNGRVSVVALVGERNTRLAGTGVVQRADIHVNGNQLHPSRVHPPQSPGFEEIEAQVPDGGMAAILGHLIESLTKHGLGGESLDPEGVREETVIPVKVHVIEIRPGVAEQPDLSHQDVPVRDRSGSFQGKVFGNNCLRSFIDQEAAEMISAGADLFVHALS